MSASFRNTAWLFPVAYAVHVAEEAPGFTAWARRNTSARYTQRDFVQNNALGFIGTVGATTMVTRQPAERRTLGLAYYTFVVTQQAVFNALFHALTTVVYREYSPGLVSSILMVPLWRRLTRAALAERRLTARDVIVCTMVAGVVHASVVARQVFFLGIPDNRASDARSER
jgi:hypothetical protein